MKKSANSTWSVSSWEESPTGDLQKGQKINRARVVKSYSGDLEGEGIVEYIMAYISETEAEFVGVEYFNGVVDGRTGSFMFRHTGTFTSGVVNSVWEVVTGSGHGDLENLSGTVTFEAGHQADYQIEFEYELP